jgi:hypothetical protein
MRGAGGKSQWALRSSSEAVLGSRGKKKAADPFQDFLINVSGDAKPLKQKVLETASGQEDFFKNMREQSKRFRHFYLKDEVDEDKLGDDRILYTATGMALKDKIKRQAAAKNAAAAKAAVRSQAAEEGCQEEEGIGEEEYPEDVTPTFSGAACDLTQFESAMLPHEATPSSAGEGDRAAAVSLPCSDEQTMQAVKTSRIRTPPSGSAIRHHGASPNADGSPGSAASRVGGGGSGVSAREEAMERSREARQARTRALFQDYGLKISASEPGLGDMRKLLAASHAQAGQAFGFQSSTSVAKGNTTRSVGAKSR